MDKNFSDIIKRLLSVSVLLLFTGYMVIAQIRDPVYQYSVPVGNRRAFLWIPPDCMYVRGVIISFSNLLERCWLEDPLIRKTASEEGLGIIWLDGGDKTKSEVTLTANLRPGEPEVLVQLMKNLADESGYSEIEFAPLKFIPEEDGLTFRVEGGFLSELPGELKGSGKKLGHASGQIKFSVITGPALQTGPETFRIQFDRQGMGGTLWLQEEHPGDDKFRHAVQPGQMSIPSRLTEGKAQVITFPEIEDHQAGTEMLELTATSDSGLPVDYYVQEGPAVIQGNKLLFTKIPVRSKFPVMVTIVAYQWGRNIEPLFQSAEPVTRTFFITR